MAFGGRTSRGVREGQAERWEATQGECGAQKPGE